MLNILGPQLAPFSLPHFRKQFDWPMPFSRKYRGQPEVAIGDVIRVCLPPELHQVLEPPLLCTVLENVIGDLQSAAPPVELYLVRDEFQWLLDQSTSGHYQ
jgi:hypothetical protein